MEFTPLMDRQRQFFRSGVTLDMQRRKEALRALLQEMERREDELLSAQAARQHIEQLVARLIREAG